jgi:hypothetical protein
MSRGGRTLRAPPAPGVGDHGRDRPRFRARLECRARRRCILEGQLGDPNRFGCDDFEKEENVMRLRSPFTCMWCAAALAVAVPLLAATLDNGKLQVSWFSDDAVFREADDIDYLWVTGGFELDGKSLHFKAWPEPEFLGPKASERDEKDHRLAKMMSVTMHEVFASAFARAYGDRIKTSLESGDVLVEGRIVDSSTGSNTAKILVGFGAGAGNTTIDVRFVDAATGKALAGFHHRVVSGTTWSTTEGKFFKWVDETAENFAKKGFQKLYAKGKKVKD